MRAGEFGGKGGKCGEGAVPEESLQSVSLGDIRQSIWSVCGHSNGLSRR